MKHPPLFEIKQQFIDTFIKDVPANVRELFESADLKHKVKPGESVAVCVGSRGTHDLKDLVKSTIECLKEIGLSPYITPAMGSHGGATGSGQIMVLADLGISESSMGVPVRASMDVVSLGKADMGVEIFFAKDVLEAKHIVVINRVKPHTIFRSDVESGLCKILAVGCGRLAGAASMHKFDLSRAIVPVAKMILKKTPILCGLAVTENALGGTHAIRLAKPHEFEQVDRALLKEAWTLLPRLPIDELDILIVDEIGKDISGAGMDPNVIGFWRREGGERKPDYKILIVLDLTEASHGNAMGIGMADLTTKRVLNQIDLQSTHLNCLTSGMLRSCRLPMGRENDRQAIEAALNLQPDILSVRLARIKNTGSLDKFWVSRSVLPELEIRNNILIHDQPILFEFDQEGSLLAFPDRQKP
jgi:hypothetical protein